MASKKQKKQKGKTLSLQEFAASLSEPAAVGQNVVYATKSKIEMNKSSWAEQMDEEDEDAELVIANKKKILLPSAPRASRGPEYDESKVPHCRPFTAYIANISYDIDEGDIYSFFKGLNIIELRLPRDTSDRLRGFGYVEFETREDLINGLCLNEQMLSGRPLRINPGQEKDRDRNQNSFQDRTADDWRKGAPHEYEQRERSDYGGSSRRDYGGNSRRDYGSGGFGRNDNSNGSDFGRSRGGDYADRDHGRSNFGSRDDRSDFGERRGGYRRFAADEEADDMSSWRQNAAPRPEPQSYDQDQRYGDSGDRDYRSGNKDRPDFRGFRDRGYGGNQDRDRMADMDRGDRDLEYRNTGDREHRGDRDREYRGDRDREYHGDRNREYRDDRDRENRSDRDQEYRGDRDRENRAERDRGYYGDRNREYRAVSDRERGFQTNRENEDGFRGDRGRDRQLTSRDVSPDFSDVRARPPRPDTPEHDRPIRQDEFTSGVSRPGDDDVEPPRPEPRKPSPPRERKKLILEPRKVTAGSSEPMASNSSIFGGARPVNTAAREREIEEKLAKQQEVDQAKRITILQRPIQSESREDYYRRNSPMSDVGVDERRSIKVQGDDRRFMNSQSDNGRFTKVSPRTPVISSSSSAEDSRPYSKSSMSNESTASEHKVGDRQETQPPVPTNAWEERRNISRNPSNTSREDMTSVPRTESIDEPRNQQNRRDNAINFTRQDEQYSPHPDSEDHKDTNSEPEDEHDLRQTQARSGDEADDFQRVERRPRKSKPGPPLEQSRSPNYQSPEQRSQRNDYSGRGGSGNSSTRGSDAGRPNYGGNGGSYAGRGGGRRGNF